MSKAIKLVLDILIGALAPVLILKYGTARMGTLPAYLTAAFVPVVWVLLDLFVITRRFNFISAYAGFGAIMRGALAFWYVTGALFAFKDSASYMLAVLVFGLSAFVARPVTRSIAFQGLAPASPEEERSLEHLMDEPTVVRALKQSAIVIALTNFAAGVVNYVINFKIVVASFNTPAFNDQVANVNAITRVVLVLPDMLALFWAFSLMYKAMYALLPAEAYPLVAMHYAATDAGARVVAFGAPVFRSRVAARRHVASLGPLARLMASDSPWAGRLCGFTCEHRELARRMAPLFAPRLPAAVAADGVDHVWASYKGTFDLITSQDQTRPLLAALGGRLTLIYGRADRVCPPSQVRPLIDEVGGVELIILPEGDHHLPLQFPQECGSLIRARADGPRRAGPPRLRQGTAIARTRHGA